MIPGPPASVISNGPGADVCRKTGGASHRIEQPQMAASSWTGWRPPPYHLGSEDVLPVTGPSKLPSLPACHRTAPFNIPWHCQNTLGVREASASSPHSAPPSTCTHTVPSPRPGQGQHQLNKLQWSGGLLRWKAILLTGFPSKLPFFPLPSLPPFLSAFCSVFIFF